MPSPASRTPHPPHLPPSPAAEYMTDPEATLTKLGVHTGPDASVVHAGGAGKPPLVGGEAVAPSSQPLPPHQCTICYESTSAYSALACGHKFCNECYSKYLCHKITDEGHECVFARCPEAKCPLVITDPLVRSLVVAGDQLAQYEKAQRLERSYVDDNPGLKWCVRPDCEHAVQAARGQLGVKCKCGQRFCFSCGQDDHKPCTCDELKRWQIKCKDDSETFNWLVSNTKACPKCGTSIEKNGGCNHMTCRKSDCKHEWCWVCMGPWKDHSGSYYACNKYDPEKEKATEAGKKKDTSRASLERYLHYYTRYTNHQNSLKLESEAKAKTEEKMKEMEKEGSKAWIDCQYLMEANEALHKCRYALQFTYVFAFYLPQSGNFRHHFEMQQTELERQTEELAEMMEKEVKEIDRQEVVHCFKMAEKRLTNLFELVDNRTDDGAGSSTDPL